MEGMGSLIWYRWPPPNTTSQKDESAVASSTLGCMRHDRDGQTRGIRVLRVIARLNVGGPALHVTYLSRGLAERGYETTLVAGDVARGEASMAWVAEQAAVEVVRLPGLSREVSPLRDLLATVRLARLIRRFRPHVLH